MSRNAQLAITLAFLVLAVYAGIQTVSARDQAKVSERRAQALWGEAELLRYLMSGKATITLEQQAQILATCEQIETSLTRSGFQPKTPEQLMAEGWHMDHRKEDRAAQAPQGDER